MKIRRYLAIDRHALLDSEEIPGNWIRGIIILLVRKRSLVRRRVCLASIEAQFGSDNLTQKKEYLFDPPDRK
jgi:hypothetical protein